MSEVLASWNDGAAKQAIVDFVTSATEPGPGFVAVADRIATFDNDGTLWVEQPLPPQYTNSAEQSLTKAKEPTPAKRSAQPSSTGSRSTCPPKSVPATISPTSQSA